MKAEYVRYMEIESQRYPSERESDYGSWMDVGSDQRSSRHENNSQSRYSNILNMVQGGGLYI